MGFLVVVLLAALWAGILVPSAVRAHRSGSPLNSIDSFERSMVMLAPTRTRPGRQVMVLARPAALGARPGRAAVLRRRRNVLLGLATGAAVTFLTAVLAGGAFWMLFLIASVLLGAYVALLVQLRVAAEEQRATVRRLPVEPSHVHVVTHPPRRRAG